MNHEFAAEGRDRQEAIEKGGRGDLQKSHPLSVFISRRFPRHWGVPEGALISFRCLCGGV
jgi:hypothetical protein